METILQKRIDYVEDCRKKIEADKLHNIKSVDDYFSKLMKDARVVSARKKALIEEEYEKLDREMRITMDALGAYDQNLQEIRKVKPDNLYETLKLYKQTTCFIRTISKGINFPPERPVDVTLQLPSYERVKEFIKSIEDTTKLTSQGLPPNMREIINPLKSSKILPVKEQTDVILNVLPNFGSSKLLYRLTENKLLGQNFRNRVYDTGPSMTLIQANNGHIFGGYTGLPWTEGAENNWKYNDECFLYTITDNRGREPARLDLHSNRKDTALFHSRTSYGWGSGHDLSINLIDIKRCESAMFSYQMPYNCQVDASKFLAGKRDNWVIDELEVFMIEDPIKEPRYQNLTTSLVFMASEELEMRSVHSDEETTQEKKAKQLEK